MSDENERSVASTGSVEPVAYQAVDEYGRPFGYAQIILPLGKWPKSQRVALYFQPQFTLTDAEREAVELAIDSMSGVEDISASWSQRETAAIATLRRLLERTAGDRPEAIGGGESDRPKPIANCDDARFAALLQRLAELDEELGLPRTPNPLSTPGECTVQGE